MENNLVDLHTNLKNPIDQKALTELKGSPGLSNINPAYIYERLNDCFGVAGWSSEAEIVSAEPKVVSEKDWKTKKQVEVTYLYVVAKVTLTINFNGQTAVRTQFGGNMNRRDEGDAYKGAVTDGLTKCASMLYVAQDVFKGLQSHKTPLKSGSQATPKVTQQQPSVPHTTRKPVKDPDVTKQKSKDEELKDKFKQIIEVGPCQGMTYNQLAFDSAKFQGEYEFTRKTFKDPGYANHKEMIDSMLETNLVANF